METDTDDVDDGLKGQQLPKSPILTRENPLLKSSFVKKE